MATYYAGPGGNDINNGLTWALRKLTLNGVEDIPVAPADVAYVGPGVYREQLDIDVSGGAGNEIAYIGDVTGENTDGVGGIVRITGSNNDQTALRNYCILDNFNTRTYRTFRGFYMDLADLSHTLTNGHHWTLEDCVFSYHSNAHAFWGPDQSDHILRRNLYMQGRAFFNIVLFTHGATIFNANHLIENCQFMGTHGSQNVVTNRVGGIAVRNCGFYGSARSVLINTALAVGSVVTVNNSIIEFNNEALKATVLGEIIEDFNTFYLNGVDRVNVAVGANSLTFADLVRPPILYSGMSQDGGFKFPWWFGELSEWSQVQAITGLNEPIEDLRGIVRPVTASKNSWGAVQFTDMERETGTVRTGVSSVAIRDAGRHQIFVPVTNVETTIKVYVYREANYAGNLPQMIIKQPGQADDITTDVAAASQWNLLTTTFTPAAQPPYVIVELVSRNTNGAADEVFFDDLDVS